MSLPEKRCFNRFVLVNSSKQERNYLILFHLIDKQDIYNEDEILKKGNFIKKNQLPDLKHYLYNMILKCLRSYRSGISADVQLKDILNDVACLYDRGLYTECRTELVRAEDVAHRHENYPHLLEIITWKEKIAGTINPAESYMEEVSLRFSGEKTRVLDILRNMNAFLTLYNRMVRLYHKYGDTRTPELRKNFDDIMKDPLMASEENALSFKAKLFFNSIKNDYYDIIGETINSYHAAKRSVELMDLYPDIKREEYKRYLSHLFNLGLAQVNLGKTHEVPGTVEKLRQVPGFLHAKLRETEDVQSDLFYFSYFLELQSCLSSGDFEKALLLIPGIERNLKLFKGKINPIRELLFHYCIAYLYFSANRFSSALQWLNKIVHSREINLKEDIYSFARILNLITHYELGNTGVLEYIVRSTYRYLSKRNRLYKVESSVLNFIRKRLSAVHPSKNLTIEFTELKQVLEELIKEPFEKKAMAYFDFISWLESKITGRSFAEIVKEKTGLIPG